MGFGDLSSKSSITLMIFSVVGRVVVLSDITLHDGRIEL